MGGTSEADRRQILCDTNIIVRLITGDPRGQAEAARRFLDRAEASRTSVCVPHVVVAELSFVLTSVYPFSDQVAAVEIKRALKHPSIDLDDAGSVYAALDLWAVTSLDFVDAYLAAMSWETSFDGILSFDRDLDKRMLGVTRVDPAHG